MVTVTECTTLGKGRLRFHLDNGTELVLYRGEAKQFRMREGSTLSDEEEHQLIYEVVGKRAKRRTMHLLEQREIFWIWQQMSELSANPVHGMLMKGTRSDRDVKMQRRICVKIRNSVR